MSEITSGRGVCPGAGWQPEPTFKQVTRTGRKVLRAEALARGRGRARLLSAGNPRKGPVSPLSKHSGAFRRLRLSWPESQLQPVQSQPTCSSTTGPRPGPADPERRERGQLLAQPIRPPTSMGLGGTFQASYRKPAVQDPALGLQEAQTFLSVGLRPELELTEERRGKAPFQPGC